MQKKIIALAVAGLVSGAAFAQSNVEIYGIMDIGYTNQRADGGTQSGLVNGGLSGSRLGFKGTEDLGGGMKAVWVYELGTLRIDEGSAGNTNNMTATRQSYLGLTGGFGTAVAGRIQTPGYVFSSKYDAMGASIFSPMGQLQDNARVVTGMSISTRDALGTQDNTVAYISPVWNGVTFIGAYSFGTDGEGVNVDGVANDSPQGIYALAATWDAGPASIGFVHHNVNDFGNASGTDQTENMIAASYDFGMVKLFGSYQTRRLEAGGADINTDRIWGIGARAPIGNGSIGIAYASYRDKEPASDPKSSSWGIDYQHNLSKRTTAYVGYSRVSNNSQNAFGLTAGMAADYTNTAAPGLGGNDRQIGFGLRHTF